MQSSIGHLHVRYQSIGSLSAADVPRVRAIIQEEMLAELETCLEVAFRGDPSVYVIRRAQCELTLGRMTREETARHAATRFAQSIVKAIREGQGDGVVRFDSEAAYLARFVTDLLRGAAWGQWYYRPLRRFEGIPVSDALDRILGDHGDVIPELLGHLHAAGVVDDLLMHIGGSGLRALLVEPSDVPTAPVSARPIFAAVIRLYESIAPPLSAAEYEATFDNCVLVHDETIDWRDRSSLTASAASMLAVLLSEADVVPQIDTERIEAALAAEDWLDVHVLREHVMRLAGPGRTAVERVMRLLQRLGVLERTVVEGRLMTLVAAEGCFEAADVIRSLRCRGAIDLEALATVSADRLTDAGVSADDIAAWLGALRLDDRHVVAHGEPRYTPQLTELLGDLRQVIRDKGLTFNGGRGDQVRLYAALVHGHPRWVEHASLAAATIERVASSPPSGLTQIEREIAQALESAAPSSANPSGAVATECAGIFLLLRAVVDARLAHLAQACRYPTADRPFGSLLTSLALHWCGTWDRAVWLLAQDGLSSDGIQAAWRATPEDRHLTFQAALLQLLAAQRMTAATEMRLQTLNSGDTAVLLAGCGVPGLWPFACRLNGRALEAVTAEWVDRWEAATGVRPDVLHEPEACEVTRSAWEALAAGQIGIVEADVSLTSIANSILKLWARWLRQFAGSGAPYLLKHFIRRRGLVVEERDALTIYMERRPLDLVLEMAGYDRDIDPIPGVFGRRVRFRWGL